MHMRANARELMSLPNLRGFQKGVFVRGRGEISIIGVVRAPVAMINFASNPCENL